MNSIETARRTFAHFPSVDQTMRESAFRRRVLSANLLRGVALFGKLAGRGAFLDLSGKRNRAGHPDLDPLDAAWVGVHHFEFDAVLDNDFASHWNMPREACDEPPKVSTSSASLIAVRSASIARKTSLRSARASTMKFPSTAASIFGLSPESCSSSILPTIISTMSSIDARPSVPPYSSMTSAMWVRVACIFTRRSRAGMDAGTKRTGRRILACDKDISKPLRGQRQLAAASPSGSAGGKPAARSFRCGAVAAPARKATKSRMCTMPRGSSRVSPCTGRREWPAVRNTSSTSASLV